MTPCGHNTPLIRENGGWMTEHCLTETGGWSHNNEPGNYGAMLYVECTKCRKSWKYSRYKNTPKWLKEYIEHLGI